MAQFTFKDVFRIAKLRTQEAADQLQVSRVTISGWKNGHKEPHVFIRERVTHFIMKVERAVAAGKLPLNDSLRKTERIEKLRSVLK